MMKRFLNKALEADFEKLVLNSGVSIDDGEDFEIHYDNYTVKANRIFFNVRFVDFYDDENMAGMIATMDVNGEITEIEFGGCGAWEDLL